MNHPSSHRYSYNRNTGNIMVNNRFIVRHETAEDGSLRFWYRNRGRKNYLESDQLSELKDAINWLRERGADFGSAVNEFARGTREVCDITRTQHPEMYFGDMGFLKWLSSDEYFAGPWKYRFSDQGEGDDCTLYDIVMNPETDEYRYTIIIPLSQPTFIP